MSPYFKKLQVLLAENPPNLGDADSVLELLYEAMNGMPLKKIDQIIYPVCRLCRDHERSGFSEGVKVGIRLQMELTAE